MECPRKYYFNYHRNWVPENPSIHLEFGVAWHLALEYLYRNGITYANIIPAFENFMLHYRKHFSAETDSIHVKNPQNAKNALISYVAKYKDEEIKVLNVEIAGFTNIAPDIKLTYRMDVVLQSPNGDIWVMDHKTASKRSQTADDAWCTSHQLWIYIHAARELYGDLVKGAIVDTTVFLKKEQNHHRIRIQRSHHQMESLYWSVMTHVDMLRWNLARMEEVTEKDESMFAFPLNPKSCTDYGRCPYLDLCMAWTDPHRRKNPGGFVESEWNPLDVKHTL